MTTEDVLEFWFAGMPNRFRDIWFQKDEEFDARCAEGFSLAVDAALDGALDPWADTPQGALALVLLLDQFPRNIHRGSHLAFAGDAHARHIAAAAIHAGHDRKLTPVQRMFLYLPFEHSESEADQEKSVVLFESLADKVSEGPMVVLYAHKHRDVIRRFGRFPGRNAALGRESTAEEETYLAETGGGF